MDRQQQKKRRPSDKKLIPFRLDAAFFFERAVRHLDRHNLQNALKYFRKAVEYEPDNPVNHCNLAGVLSEMGSFEESNAILENVLQSIDPQMHECYFYMANNWANLGDYDKAEEYAARYLDLEPQGEFAQDAEEMLQILIEEFGGGEVLRKRLAEREAERREQDLPRKLLEQGKFMEAVAHLQMMVEQHPELTAPRNNLSLAYYYLGRLDKAIEIAREVLEKDPGNLHARCNLAVYLQHLEQTEELSVLLDGLRKVYPLQFDQCYKLATTMGILGEHAIAHRLFVQLARWSQQADPPLLHCVAASACNVGNYRLARRIWKDIQLLDPDGEVAAFYLRALDEAEAAGVDIRPVSYHYQIPFQEQFKRIQEQMKAGEAGAWQDDPLIRSSLFWALQHGEPETKVQVIQTFALIADREVEQALQEFVRRPDELEQLKLLAIYVLKHIGAEGSFPEVAEFNRDWKAIRDKARSAVGVYADHLEDAASRIWSDFLVQSLQQPPHIASLNTWAAGLAYYTLRQHGVAVTQTELAERFGVSPSSVSKISRQIANTLQS